MKSLHRSKNRWPPRWTAYLVNALLPHSSRYSDYRDFLRGYRSLVSVNSTKRAVNYATWRACDDTWRAVPDYVKHGLIAMIVKMLPGGN